MQPQSKPKRPVGVIIIAVIAAAGGLLSLFGAASVFSGNGTGPTWLAISSHLRHSRPITGRRILRWGPLGLDGRNRDLHCLDTARNSGDTVWGYRRRDRRSH